MSREAIWAEVFIERERQDALWGASHDDAHSRAEWVAILARQVGLAVDDGSPSAVSEDRFARQMIRVAAVCLAALEAHERLGLGSLPTSCQTLADRWGEAVLMVLDPPVAPISGYRSQIPYGVLISQASPEDIRAAVRRFEPQTREVTP